MHHSVRSRRKRERSTKGCGEKTSLRLQQPAKEGEDKFVQEVVRERGREIAAGEERKEDWRRSGLLRGQQQRSGRTNQDLQPPASSLSPCVWCEIPLRSHWPWTKRKRGATQGEEVKELERCRGSEGRRRKRRNTGGRGIKDGFVKIETEKQWRQRSSDLFCHLLQ